ncbi:cupin domain-containing protein [Methylobacterium sp. J-070]|uniref:cupin domain-containing protein n=1 Tax=Methylobacterium sp. J-070 TaxID=2836650 RepID=UPI002443DDCE
MIIAALFHGAPLHAETSQHETVAPAFQSAIPNIPGKSLVSAVVEYPPGAKSPSHHHASSAFVYAYVLSGAVRSQVNEEPARVYRAGESFSEAPGAHHVISENASDTEPARLLAVFILDTGDHPLTTPDR